MVTAETLDVWPETSSEFGGSIEAVGHVRLHVLTSTNTNNKDHVTTGNNLPLGAPPPQPEQGERLPTIQRLHTCSCSASDHIVRVTSYASPSPPPGLHGFTFHTPSTILDSSSYHTNKFIATGHTPWGFFLGPPDRPAASEARRGGAILRTIHVRRRHGQQRPPPAARFTR